MSHSAALMAILKIPIAAIVLLAGAPLPGCGRSGGAAASGSTLFAVIGDYGWAGQAERDVAALVTGWSPDFIVTAGDNNYPDGGVATIDENIGQYYSEYIYPYTGGYGSSATTNLFFPALGNHDWRTAGAQPYLDYFTLPGKERYYDFVRGPVNVFVLDTGADEPDGTSSDSIQAAWLREGLTSSSSTWKLVVAHHPPFSSGLHGSTASMQWSFGEWGATGVISAHDHTYERIIRDGMPYFVNGLGGNPSIYQFEAPVSGSLVRYNADYGAMLIEAAADSLTFQFITRAHEVIDTCTVDASGILRNYVKIEINAANAAPGSGIGVSWECDVAGWNYGGVPVNIYVAAIRNPTVAGGASSLSEALAGGQVWLAADGMREWRRYAGGVEAPTWSGVAFPPAPTSGTKTLQVPNNPALAGAWRFATVFVRADGSGFIRTDGLPVENSNILLIQ